METFFIIMEVLLIAAALVFVGYSIFKIVRERKAKKLLQQMSQEKPVDNSDSNTVSTDPLIDDLMNQIVSQVLKK